MRRQGGIVACLYGEDFIDEVPVHLDGVIGVVGWGGGIWGRGVSSQFRCFRHALSMVWAEGVLAKGSMQVLVFDRLGFLLLLALPLFQHW